MLNLDRIKALAGNRGASIMAVLVAVGLTGVVAVGISNMLSGSFRAQSSLAMKGDLEAIKRSMLNRVDCPQSILNAGGVGACSAAGTLIDVVDHKGHVFISHSGSKFGHWAVRAYCKDDGLVYMDAARLKSGHAVAMNPDNPDADFETDQIIVDASKAPSWSVQSWANMQSSFFPAGISVCGLGAPVCRTVTKSVPGAGVPAGKLRCPNPNEVMTSATVTLAPGGNSSCITTVSKDAIGYWAHDGNNCDIPVGAPAGSYYQTMAVCCTFP